MSRGYLRLLLALLLACLATAGGCTAITNPVADGIPVRLLPPEIIGPAKICWQTIPLNVLRQPQPDVYRLAPGDVLGVYIDGFIGDRRNLAAAAEAIDHVHLVRNLGQALVAPFAQDRIFLGVHWYYTVPVLLQVLGREVARPVPLRGQAYNCNGADAFQDPPDLFAVIHKGILA